MCENNTNRFLFRMANLLILIHNGGIKLLYSPDLIMRPIFLVLHFFKLLNVSYYRNTNIIISARLLWIIQLYCNLTFLITVGF